MNLNSTTLIGKLLRFPLRFIPSNALFPVLSGPLRGCKWVAGASVHGCWLGWYEKTKVRLFVNFLTPRAVVYDVGANAGYYTLIAAKYCSKGCVFAFEPLPQNVVILRRHLSINQFHNVKVLEAAVSNSDEQAFFKIDPCSSMGHLGSNGDLPVRVLALDASILRGEIDEPDIIKMDIEGGEYDALCGAIDLLKRKMPTLFLATHGEDEHGACCRLLEDIGYELTSIGGSPLSETSEILACSKNAKP